MIAKAFITAVSSLATVSMALAADLEEIASFPKQQVTGIGVSAATGRVFVNFPFWSPDHTISVAEVKDGKPSAYPDESWNRKDGDAKTRFVCVQSVVVDDTDVLWILDAGSPMQQGVIEGGAKLVQVDLKTDKVVRTIPIGNGCAPKKSYLNDVRIDTKTGHAFITESGVGSLIVVDLKAGTPRRVLADHPSTKVEIGRQLAVDGIKPIDPDTEGTPQFHADGIAYDKEKGVLYYHALTADTLYRIDAKDLVDSTLSPAELGEKVQKVGETPAPDGMLEETGGTLLLAAFEKNAIARVYPRTGKSIILIEDKRLQWPDTLSWGPGGDLYVTTSQIHRTPKYNHGESKLQEPFKVYRIRKSALNGAE